MPLKFHHNDIHHKLKFQGVDRGRKPLLDHPQSSDDPRSTLNRCSIDTRSTLYWNHCWRSIDTTSILHGHHGRQSVDESNDFRSIHMSPLTLSGLETGDWSSVDRVLTEYRSGCWSSIDPNVDRRYRSKVLIDTEPQIPLVHITCSRLLKVSCDRKVQVNRGKASIKVDLEVTPIHPGTSKSSMLVTNQRLHYVTFYSWRVP